MTLIFHASFVHQNMSFNYEFMMVSKSRRDEQTKKEKMKPKNGCESTFEGKQGEQNKEDAYNHRPMGGNPRYATIEFDRFALTITTSLSSFSLSYHERR
jgi:hypothetical protein